MSGGAAIGRNRVGVQVWEGTQWLLRDEDRRVRRAYVDAILTWLRLEMSSNDLRVLEDKRKLLRTTSKTDVNSNRKDTMAKRAVSNASQRETNGKPSKSTFLQLLHLAIYDNAIEAPESESDLLLMHLLLVNLVEKLGVNAAKSGLPMIMRLQEDVNVDELISTPTAKINIGSLVHGHFWTLCNKFDFDTSTVGFVVQSEISRRKQHGLWLDTVQVPPLPIDRIMSATSRPLTEKIPLPVVQTESLRPFDSRPCHGRSGSRSHTPWQSRHLLTAPHLRRDESSACRYSRLRVPLRHLLRTSYLSRFEKLCFRIGPKAPALPVLRKNRYSPSRSMARGKALIYRSI